MEGKRKDINQMYREMEEAVAQRVRETMELADARRRALAQSSFMATEQISLDNRREKAQEVVETSQELMNVNNKINESEKDAIRMQEIIVDDEDRLKVEEIQQELKDINRSIEEEQAKMYRVVEVDDDVKDVEPTADNVLQIHFEHSKTVENAEKDDLHSTSHPTDTTDDLNVVQMAIKERDYPSDNTDHSINARPLQSTPSAEQTSQINFELPINDPPYQQSPYDTYEFENERELAQDALNLPQNAVRNTENMSQQLVDNTRITEPLQTITNPFDLIDEVDSELQIGENALNLTETTLTNYSTNPFESSDDEVEIRLGEGTISMVQDWRNQTINPFTTVEDPMEIRQLGEEALNIAQNASRNYTTNPFDMFDEEEMRLIGADALTIAQVGARNVDATKRQLSENAEDLDNAFNSLIDTADRQNPLIEIGFDHLEHTFGQEIGNKDENRNYSHF